MQWKLPNYINKAWRMSNPVRRVASKTESIFIEKDRLQEIQAMRYLLSQGSAEEIQKHFFPSSKSTEFNLSKLTQGQINRHAKVLDRPNKEILKNALQKGSKAPSTALDMKAFSEQKTNYSAVDSDRDINQYLAIDEQADLLTLSKSK